MAALAAELEPPDGRDELIVVAAGEEKAMRVLELELLVVPGTDIDGLIANEGVLGGMDDVAVSDPPLGGRLARTGFARTPTPQGIALPSG